MSEKKAKNKISIIILVILLAAVCIAAISGCSNLLDEAYVIIIYEKDTPKVIEKIAGDEPFKLQYYLSYSEIYEDPVWEITGDSLDCTISQNGVVTPGEIIGSVVVKITAKIKENNYRSATVTVNIIGRVLTDLRIDSMPAQTEYIEGQMFDTTGIKVTAVYENREMDLKKFSIDKTEDLLPSDTSITLSYTENGITKSKDIPITVSIKTLRKLEINGTAIKTNYVEGESFDDSNMLISAVYEYKKQVITDYTSDIPDILPIGDSTFTFTYTENGVTKTIDLEITVAERVLTNLEIVTYPDVMEYRNGQKLNISGLTAKAVFNDGALEYMANELSTDKGNRPLLLTDTAVVVSYTEKGITKSAVFEISIAQRTFSNIVITSYPEKLNYVEGEYFDIFGLNVKACYTDSDDSSPSSLIIDKQGIPLRIVDNKVILTYTENGITSNAEINITVTEQSGIDGDVVFLVYVIGSIPQTENLTLTDKNSVIYAQSLYDALSSEQQAQITNYQKLSDACIKIAQLEAEKPEEKEIEYIISYSLYDQNNDQCFKDITFGDNPLVYKNSMGALNLANAVSLQSEAIGYVFLHWIDSKTYEIKTVIESLDSNKNYIAVFQLTETITLSIMDYDNKMQIYYESLAVNRKNNDEYFFSLSDITNDIFTNYSKMALIYYYIHPKDNIDTLCETGKIPTNYGLVITIYAVTANVRNVEVADKNDILLNWSYQYIESNITKYINKIETQATTYILPVTATVTVKGVNPLIKDILIDSVASNILPPDIETSFVLNAGETPVRITFSLYEANATTITFSGSYTKSYVYYENWNGTLPEKDLIDIATIFAENDNYYINKYTIAGEAHLFNELAIHKFTSNTVVIVTRLANNFSFILNYSGGNYTVSDLIGKQTLSTALSAKGYGSNASITNFLDSIFEELALYYDEAHESIIDSSMLLQQVIIDNIIIYAATRTAYTVTLDLQGGTGETTLNVLADDGEEFFIAEVLPRPQYAGYLFEGWALMPSGEVLFEYYLNTVLQNKNQNVILYAIWAVDEGYIAPPPPADYTGYEHIGTWSAAYSNELGVISSELSFMTDGTYTYKTYINGTITSDIWGIYTCTDGLISIFSLIMDEEHQLINAASLTVNTSFIDYNVMTAPVFIIDGFTVQSYTQMLTKGTLIPANYYGNNLLGDYVYTSNGEAGIIETMTITLNANGTASILDTKEKNGIKQSEQLYNGYFRLYGDSIIYLSNGALGIADITEIISLAIKNV